MLRRRMPVLVAGLIALLVGCVSVESDDPETEAPRTVDESGGSDGEASDATTTTTSADGELGGTQLLGGIPEVVREVEPSVVAVFSGAGEGSGVVWDSDGTIVTNHHVVAGADDFEVVFADGERSPARLVASDPLTDLAVLRSERDGIPAATFASELPEVGELAIAIGNPLGFENTVTAGIVSALNRSIPGTAPVNQSLIDLIQTDAAISPGNSGGALVDASGEVIGINVAYIPPSARAVSIGFAIPAPTVTDVVEQLLEDGAVSHPYLGLRPAPLTPQIRQQLGVEVETGVVVLEVVPDAPAADAGLRPGDVMIEVDGESVGTVEGFLAALRGREPGEDVSIVVMRGGEELELTPTLADRSELDGG